MTLKKCNSSKTVPHWVTTFIVSWGMRIRNITPALYIIQQPPKSATVIANMLLRPNLNFTTFSKEKIHNLMLVQLLPCPIWPHTLPTKSDLYFQHLSQLPAVTLPCRASPHPSSNLMSVFHCFERSKGSVQRCCVTFVLIFTARCG